ncbi:unnamed protein product [Haemonchus placei]|uniref:Uncharacterized protein n=1 Tax=Haemonchus placei TaxID=6290 RepID=A0A158QRJ3_HAEPC|nr:unnamed protein product [Haemonchus placei]
MVPFGLSILKGTNSIRNVSIQSVTVSRQTYFLFHHLSQALCTRRMTKVRLWKQIKV